MIKYLKILILLFSTVVLFSQSTIDAYQFFNIGKDRFPNVERKANEVINFPWIEEYEFRTRTRDFEFDKQDYIFRLSPSTPQKRRAQQSIYDLLINTPDFEAIEEICNTVYSSHEDWLAIYITTESLAVYTQLNDVLNDKQKLIDKSAGIYKYDFDDIVKLQSAKSEVAIQDNELQLELNYLRDKYALPIVGFDFEDFVEVENVRNKLLEIHGALQIQEDPEDIFEKDLISREIELEEAEKRQYVDFAQVRYEGPHSDFLSERISLGLGLRFPNSGNQKLKILELQLKQDEIERDQERKAWNIKQNLNEIHAKLQLDIKAYENYKSVMEQERQHLKNLGNKITTQEGYSPYILLDIDERHLHSKIELLKKKQDVLSDYLKYLDRSGQMCLDPETIFLRN